MTPHKPTPDWATDCMKRIVDKYDDPDLLDAALELLAGVIDQEGDKYRNEAAWAAIEYGYTKTKDFELQARRYVGAA